MAATAPAPTTNPRLLQWVDEIAALCEPDTVHWFDGSDGERELLVKQLLAAGTFTALDPAKRPDSYWARSDPSDVARVEDRTFTARPSASSSKLMRGPWRRVSNRECSSAFGAKASSARSVSRTTRPSPESGSYMRTTPCTVDPTRPRASAPCPL